MFLTSVLAAVIVAALVAVDVLFAVDHVAGNTWSEVIRFWGARVALLPFAWGMLGLHFFHPEKMWHLDRGPGIAVLAWSAVVCQIVGMAFPIPMMTWFIVGAIAGALCWPV